MTEETREPELKNEDIPADEGETETQNVSDPDSESTCCDKDHRPFINYTSGGRTGSIWNSPLGLVATFFLVSKAIDLGARIISEKQKAAKKSQG